MTRPRTAAALSLAALLSVAGGSAIATGAAAAQTDPPTTEAAPDSSPVLADPALPTDISVNLPGLGEVALSVDPGTGEIVSVLITPIDGVTAADPIPVHGGILLTFTLADGTVQALIVEIEIDDDGIEIDIEPVTDDEDDDGDDDGDDDEWRGGPPPVSERGNSAEHRNDDNEHSRGRHLGTSTTVTSGSTSPTTRSSTEVDDDDDEDDDAGGGRSSNPARGSRDD